MPKCGDYLYALAHRSLVLNRKGSEVGQQLFCNDLCSTWNAFGNQAQNEKCSTWNKLGTIPNRELFHVEHFLFCPKREWFQIGPL